jgi:hypothetical protein
MNTEIEVDHSKGGYELGIDLSLLQGENKTEATRIHQATKNSGGWRSKIHEITSPQKNLQL